MKRPTVEELMDPNGQYVKRQVDVSLTNSLSTSVFGSRPAPLVSLRISRNTELLAWCLCLGNCACMHKLVLFRL